MPLELDGTDVHFKFAEKVLRAPLPVVVEFCKNNSGYSFLINATLEEFEEPMRGKMEFYRINIDKHTYFNRLYNLNDTPTVVLFVKGVIGASIVGPFSSAKFESSMISRINALE